MKKWLTNNYKFLGLLGFLVFIVYANSFPNGFVADDIPGILQNKDIGNFSAIFSHPLGYLGFLRDFFYYFINKIGGLNPLYYRLFNVCLHLGSTWLIFAILTRVLNPRIGLFAASLFAVHPIQSEAVTWISGGPYSQYTFFLLFSFLLYLVYKDKPSFKFYLLSLVSFLLSLLSTEKGAVFPLILILYEYSFGNVKTGWKRIIPFFIISGAWFLLFLYFGQIGDRVSLLQNTYYQEGGMENPLIQIPVAISSYLNLIFIPIGLTLYHSEETILNNFEYFTRLTVFIIFIFSLVYCLKKNKSVFFWLSFFFMSLWPVLLPLKISSVVAERYVYLGSLGLYVVMALFAEKLSQIDKNPKVFYVFLIMILPVLGILTIARNADWKNQDTLWLAAAKTSPSSAQNHNNLGDYYGRRENYEKAVEEFQTAIKLQPNYGDAYHNLGNTYQQMQKYDLALANYQKALELNPNLWQSYVNIGIIYYNYGDRKKAQEEFQKALEINPQNAEIKKLLLQTNP